MISRLETILHKRELGQLKYKYLVVSWYLLGIILVFRRYKLLEVY